MATMLLYFRLRLGKHIFHSLYPGNRHWCRKAAVFVLFYGPRMSPAVFVVMAYS